MDIYGLMKMGLDATELRNRTIANNIVNINTPNYKRKYVTFKMDPIWWTREKACLSIWDLFLYNIN